MIVFYLSLLLFAFQSFASITEISNCDIFRNISYIPEARMLDKKPPLLLSFPGSGNTWVRMLIETISGFYSGSIDVNDSELKNQFPGEKSCGLRLSIIKGHPSDFILQDHDSEEDAPKANSGQFGVGNPPSITGFTAASTTTSLENGVWKPMKFMFRQHRRKCSRGWIRGFEKVLFLSRDPYASIFSEYQRHATGQHNGTLTLEQFNVSHWSSFALHMSFHIAEKWDRLIYPLMKQYKEKYHFVRYEDIRSNLTQLQTLSGIARFMDYNATDQRVACAFSLADRPFAHRKSSLSIGNVLQVKDDPAQSLVCKMWSNLRYFSGNFSYNIWNNVTC